MRNLVNDLLDYAAMEAGRLGLALKRTNIVDLVERNVDLNRVRAEKRAIAIEFASERISVEVLVDQVRFTQVLNNLLVNALKFAPEGSNVVVRLGCDEATTEISVHNDGEGIPAEDAQRIFDPFERGRTGGTWGEKSTGLGLAIVKWIVDAQHGEIRVESEPGQGVTMVVCVPLARLAVSRREREAEIS
jgi:signal transduction histidine kinase